MTPFNVNQLQTSVKPQIEIGVIVACRTVLQLNSMLLPCHKKQKIYIGTHSESLMLVETLAWKLYTYLHPYLVFGIQGKPHTWFAMCSEVTVTVLGTLWHTGR